MADDDPRERDARGSRPREITELPAATRAALGAAACVGQRASLEIVAAACNQTREAVSTALESAARLGRVITVVPAGAEPGRGGEVFEFVDDRTRDEAYRLLAGRARAQTHLRIGRYLLGDELRRPSANHGADDGKLLVIADQLLLGSEEIVSRPDRIAVARLLLRAGRRARASAGTVTGFHYVRRAVELLPRDVWATDHDLATELHREGMEGAFAANQPALGDEYLQVAMAEARSDTERARLCALRVDACLTRRDLNDATAWIRRGLALVGRDLDPAVSDEVIAAEVAAVPGNRGGRSFAEVLGGPLMVGPELLAEMQLLQRAQHVVYFTAPRLFPFVVARAVNLSLRHGHAEPSAPAFIGYAVLLHRTGGDHEQARGFGRLGLAVAERLGHPVYICRSIAIFTASVGALLEPIDNNLPLVREAEQRGIEAGDFLFASTCPITAVAMLFHRGAPLATVAQEIDRGEPLARATEAGFPTPTLHAYRRAHEHLVGTDGQHATDDAGGHSRLVLRLQVSFILRDFAAAARYRELAKERLYDEPWALAQVDHNFYASLTCAALHDEQPIELRAPLLAEIADNQRTLARWSEGCPQNFRHKHTIVAAEQARVEGRALDAAELFEVAISEARRERFAQDEALAHELAGRFHAAQGRRQLAARYLAAANEGYRRWGALAKVQALTQEVEALGLASTNAPAPPDDTRAELEPLMRAAEALTREVTLDRLSSKLVEVGLAATRAERGALVLDEEGTLVVRAVGSILQPANLQREPLAEARRLPRALIEKVASTRQPIVLVDASTQSELWPAPAPRPVRAALALPLLRLGALVGVVYLENHAAMPVFGAAEREVLQLLSARIAAALANGLLFERSTREIQERRRAEADVRFLAEAGAALSQSLDYQVTLREVARLVVPHLADWCVVDVVEEGKVRRVATAHTDPEKEATLDRLGRADEVNQPRAHISHVMSTHAPLLYDEVTRQSVDRFADDPELAKRIHEIGAKSSMVLPLVARGRALGAMTLVSSSWRRFNAADLSIAQELARRAAVAIDNARLYRESQDAVRARDEFLSLASRELNAPIAALSMVAQSLTSERATDVPPTLARTTQIISRQTRRLKTLVADLLDLAHIHIGQLHLRPSEVDLAELVRETVERFSTDLARAGCPVSLELAGGVVGRWDRTRIEQVVTNLLSNAMKFAPGKPVDLRVERHGDGARLSIEDQGAGIAPEFLPHVFGRFEQGVAGAPNGLGLGLYIVHEIVAAHGGRVDVVSVVGAGCKFTVDLPLEPPPPRAVSA